MATEAACARVTGGIVRGVDDAGITVFRGVPYAAPIGGANRWRAPQPVIAWDGVRDATRFGAACPQPRPSATFVRRLMRWKRTGRAFVDAISDLGAEMGDDCLNLNVWTPSPDPQAKLPVLIFIHGGSFTSGAGSQPLYDGRALARAGLVVVTINYRLGAMGFIGGDGLFPDGLGIANRGYLDQLQALRWVNANIRAFGGDPDRVTLSGESAGAASALMMAMSPATVGLVHRVVSMSGAPLSYPHAECSLLAGDCFAGLGVAPGDAAALAALDAQDLDRLQPQRLLSKNPKRYGTLGDDRLGTLVAATGTELFPHAPETMLANRRGLDMLIGTCKDEARLWSVVLPLPGGLATRMMFNAHGGLMKPKHRPQETFKAYRALMPGVSARLVRERAMTDSLFRRPSVAAAGSMADSNPGHVFLYRYDWPAAGLGGAFGAIHGVDLPGMFQTDDIMRAVLGPEDGARPAGDAFHRAIVSFTKTGAPEVPGVAWPAYDRAAKPCMIIDRTCTVRNDVDVGFEDIW